MAAESKNHKILIVDDMAENIRILNEILKSDYMVIFAMTGKKALDLAISQKPDLILLDVMMPELNGYEVCAELKGNPVTSEIPIIFISAMHEVEDETKGLNLGAVDYIVKPVSPSIVNARVKNHLKLQQTIRDLKAANKKIEEQRDDLEKTLEQVSYLSRTDMLTGLSNRRDILEKIDDETSRGKRTKNSFSIIIMDIDNFKFINDRYGHDCGDFVLRRIADILKSLSRAHDTPSRWGGEEFLILLPDTDSAGAQIHAERIRVELEKLNLEYNTYQLWVTATFGVAGHNKLFLFDKTLKIADTALYEGKAGGKNCVVVGR